MHALMASIFSTQFLVFQPHLPQFPHRHRFSGLIVSAQAPTAVQFDVNGYMVEKAGMVNRALGSVIPEKATPRMRDVMRYSLLAPGGNRVQSTLCLAACKLVGGLEQWALPVALAVEMVHTMSIVHGDLPCMANNDLWPPGKPTCHKAFDESTAVLSGIALHGLAFQTASDLSAYPANVSCDRVARAVGELARCYGAEALAASQLVRLESTGLNEPIPSHKLQYIHSQKTAALLEAAVVTGAIIGGGSDEQIERLRAYAQTIGLLFTVTGNKLNPIKSSSEEEFAEELIGRAKEQLKGFDDQELAAPLVHLAEHIAYCQTI